MARRRTGLPASAPVAVTDPSTAALLESIVERLEALEGAFDASERRPTVQEMIDAGIAGAEALLDPSVEIHSRRK